MSKKVRILVTPKKAAQLRLEARYRDILDFLYSERKRLDRAIARLREKITARDKKWRADWRAAHAEKVRAKEEQTAGGAAPGADE